MTFSISTFFVTPWSNGDQFCLMPKVLANLPGPKAFLHQSCASSSRTPASSLPGRMLMDVFLLLFVIDILIFVRSLKWRKKEQTWKPFAKIPSEMEIAPRYNSLHCWHCWHCWPCWNCWHCWSYWSCLHCWGARGADGADVAAIYILSHGKNTIGNRLYGFMGLRGMRGLMGLSGLRGLRGLTWLLYIFSYG